MIFPTIPRWTPSGLICWRWSERESVWTRVRNGKGCPQQTSTFIKRTTPNLAMREGLSQHSFVVTIFAQRSTLPCQAAAFERTDCPRCPRYTHPHIPFVPWHAVNIWVQERLLFLSHDGSMDGSTDGSMCDLVLNIWHHGDVRPQLVDCGWLYDTFVGLLLCLLLRILPSLSDSTVPCTVTHLLTHSLTHHNVGPFIGCVQDLLIATRMGRRRRRGKRLDSSPDGHHPEKKARTHLLHHCLLHHHIRKNNNC